MPFQESPSLSGPCLDEWAQRVELKLLAQCEQLTTRLTAFHRDAKPLGASIVRAASGGKLLRSRLLGACLIAYGEQLDEHAEHLAVVLELMHTALVFHDDVIDDDLTRRAKLNVAGEFAALHPQPDAEAARTDGKAIAVVAGDVVLTLVFGLLRQVRADIREACAELIEHALLAAAVGEHLDVVYSWPGRRVDSVDARSAAYLKTAVYSFEAPLVSGLLLAGAPAAHHEGIRGASRLLGEAYQVVDDVLGAFAYDTVLGRQRASDLELHRETAVIVAARMTEHWEQITDLRYHTDSQQAVDQLREALEESGAKELALGRAQALAAAADQELRDAGLPAQLCDHVQAMLSAMIDRAR